MDSDVIVQTPTPTPTPAPAAYVLTCQGCPWQHPDPHRFEMAKVLAHAHQLKVAGNMAHAVLFLPVTE